MVRDVARWKGTSCESCVCLCKVTMDQNTDKIEKPAHIDIYCIYSMAYQIKSLN